MSITMILGMVVFVCFVAVMFWAYARIVQRAGYSRWLALFILFPILNLVLIWVFAFAKWPNSPQNEDSK